MFIRSVGWLSSDRHKNRVCEVRRAGKLDQDGQAQA
jgi:hypothetical protein